MIESVIPQTKVLKRKASVIVKCTKEEAFAYISSSSKLHEWLQKSGAIPGAKSVDLLEGEYDNVGDRRKITFVGGDTAIEQLLSYHPPANYAYKITDFSNFFKKLTDAAYGGLWFDDEDGKTKITWEYSFTYKNIFARMFLSMFLTFSYKKFLQHDLEIAKGILEK